MRSGAYPNPQALPLRLAGHLCVALLEGLRRTPVWASETLLLPALGVYPLLRSRHARRLKSCFAASPFPDLSLKSYYASRLKLLMHGLRIHGREMGSAIRVEGMEHYEKALAGNRPIALIGLHSGLLELLHRIPEAPAGRSFLILTAPAFSQPLTDFMARGRERDGKRVLWIGPGQDGLERGLREVIASRGVLALMADQHPGVAEECEYLALWNRVKVPYPARLLRFLSGQGFQLVPVSTRLEADGISRFRYHPALGDPSAGGIRTFLEESITAAPDQWNWSYPKITV